MIRVGHGQGQFIMEDFHGFEKRNAVFKIIRPGLFRNKGGRIRLTEMASGPVCAGDPEGNRAVWRLAYT